MVISKRAEFELFFFVLLGIAVGAFFVIRTKEAPLQNLQTVPILLASPTPTPTSPFVPKTRTESQISSDGTKKVILKITTNEDETKTYEVMTTEDGPSIFKETLGHDESMRIPYNTWDPQDKYFFIEEDLKTEKKFMVFNATGEPLADGETYLDLTAAFKQKVADETLDAATGWGGYDVIVINTKQQDNTQGPSYWFEVPSKNIVGLSAKF